MLLNEEQNLSHQSQNCDVESLNKKWYYADEYKTWIKETQNQIPKW